MTKYKPAWDGTFKIEIHKRHTALTSLEIINAIAPLIDNTVNLDNPDWLVLVEIVADRFGLSFIKPDLIFSAKIANEQPRQAKTNWFLD